MAKRFWQNLARLVLPSLKYIRTDVRSIFIPLLKLACAHTPQEAMMAAAHGKYYYELTSEKKFLQVLL